MVTRWVVSLVVSAALLYGGQQLYRAYTHFTWVTMQAADGHVYAIPAFVK